MASQNVNTSIRPSGDRNRADSTYTHTRLPHQADALRLLDDQLDQPQRTTGRDDATDAESDGGHEPPRIGDHNS
jgi:hypothetical protein